jgi:hypothetical protein
MSKTSDIWLHILLLKTRKERIISYVTLGIAIIYLAILYYPTPFFRYSYQYQNFSVHSTEPFGDSIQAVLAHATRNLQFSEINSNTTKYNVYFCNNFGRFMFFAPLSRGAYAHSNAFHNIFMAKSDINYDLTYSDGWSTKLLSKVLAHEATHKLIRNKLSFGEFLRLPKWKIEGYCEYIGYHDANTLQRAKKYLMGQEANYHYRPNYLLYRYAITFLVEARQMSFDDIVATDLTFEQILGDIRNLEFDGQP